jgi:hypothetical protein
MLTSASKSQLLFLPSIATELNPLKSESYRCMAHIKSESNRNEAVDDVLGRELRNPTSLKQF